MAKRLQKVEIVIWCDPEVVNAQEYELDHLAREAETGSAYCSKMKVTVIEDYKADPDWDGTEFFDEPLDGEGAEF